VRNWLKFCSNIFYTGLFTALFWQAIDFQGATSKRLLRSNLEVISSVARKPIEGKLVSSFKVDRKDSLNCPENLETLTNLMLRDLPNYANREIARRKSLSEINEEFKVSKYVIVAGKPEFEPINLNNLEYDPVFNKSPEQLFFTTLEREYINNKAVEIQNFHRLFLARSDSGWRMAMLFSRLGKTNKNEIPLPPKETSNSYIGRAIKTWLKDCRAGVLSNK